MIKFAFANSIIIVYMYSYPFIYIAVPCMNEMEYLPQFINCIKRQTIKKFKLFICVNQPQDWWEKEDKIIIESKFKKIKAINDEIRKAEKQAKREEARKKAEEKKKLEEEKAKKEAEKQDQGQEQEEKETKEQDNPKK